MVMGMAARAGPERGARRAAAAGGAGGGGGGWASC